MLNGLVSEDMDVGHIVTHEDVLHCGLTFIIIEIEKALREWEMD